MPERLERIAKQIAAAYRCTAELDYDFSVDVLVNDEAATEVAKGAILKVIDDPKMFLTNLPRQMGAEDFAEYTPVVPGAFAILGGGANTRSTATTLPLMRRALRQVSLS